jgi:hypothetical protein
VSPFGAGCAAGGGRGGGGAGGAGGANPGPFVLPGAYTVSLIVDGKTVDSKPLKVAADPDVALTAIERKKLFDLAMEMHDLQRAANQASGAITPLNARMAEIGKEIGGRSDIPADVKASVDGLAKDLGAVAPKFAAPAGGRGGGGGGGAVTPPVSVAGRITQAKNGLMGGMWPTSQTMRSYDEAKAQAPKAFAEANAAISKASALSGVLAKYKLTLEVPEPVKLPAAAVASKK